MELVERPQVSDGLYMRSGLTHSDGLTKLT